jgi:arabinogalactan endo-1,4-beta-galactosidase
MVENKERVYKTEDKHRVLYFKEEFEDIKGVIRIRVWKKNRQHNGQKKKYKRTNNDLKKTTT